MADYCVPVVFCLARGVSEADGRGLCINRAALCSQLHRLADMNDRTSSAKAANFDV